MSERDWDIVAVAVQNTVSDDNRIDALMALNRLRETTLAHRAALQRFVSLCGEPGENPLNPGWDEANVEARALLAVGDSS